MPELDLTLDLDREQRLLLLRFVCSFAWADQEIRPEERDYVAHLVRRFDLDEDDRRQVDAWLEEPPGPPQASQVPAQHRARFVQAVESVIAADREVAPVEREALVAFARRIVRSRPPGSGGR